LASHGLPRKSGDHVDAPSTDVNLADALSSTSSYYTYPGSLTTPPCTETVTWFVLRRYAQLSSTQFEAFRHITGNNFRPAQHPNGRVIRSTGGDEDEQ
jgi:carbonic anhydrase